MALIKVKAKNLEVGDVFTKLESIHRESMGGKILGIREDHTSDEYLWLTIEVKGGFEESHWVSRNSKATISVQAK